MGIIRVVLVTVITSDVDAELGFFQPSAQLLEGAINALFEDPPDIAVDEQVSDPRLTSVASALYLCDLDYS